MIPSKISYAEFSGPRNPRQQRYFYLSYTIRPTPRPRHIYNNRASNGHVSVERRAGEAEVEVGAQSLRTENHRPTDSSKHKCKESTPAAHRPNHLALDPKRPAQQQAQAGKVAKHRELSIEAALTSLQLPYKFESRETLTEPRL